MPVRTIAATPWVLDPVAVAIDAVQWERGVEPYTAPNGQTYMLQSDRVPCVRVMSYEEARRRVLASNADAEKWADAANHDRWRETAPVSVAPQTGHLRLKIGGKLHVCRPHEAIFA